MNNSPLACNLVWLIKRRDKAVPTSHQQCTLNATILVQTKAPYFQLWLSKRRTFCAQNWTARPLGLLAWFLQCMRLWSEHLDRHIKLEFSMAASVFNCTFLPFQWCLTNTVTGNLTEQRRKFFIIPLTKFARGHLTIRRLHFLQFQVKQPR